MFILLYCLTRTFPLAEESGYRHDQSFKRRDSFIVRGDERITCQTGNSVFQSDVLETGNNWIARD